MWGPPTAALHLSVSRFAQPFRELRDGLDTKRIPIATQSKALQSVLYLAPLTLRLLQPVNSRQRQHALEDRPQTDQNNVQFDKPLQAPVIHKFVDGPKNKWRRRPR
jgi:hypothetical protein